MILKILGALCPLILIQFSFAQTPDLDKGRRLYLSKCIQCHNKDPNIKGSLGPELVDAPLEVMKYKVKTGRYPDVLPKGFIPKRKTKAMRPLPALEKDVPVIYAWIQSVNRKAKKIPNQVR
ncbi:MAG TPA: cytochrome c [Bacteriovoracaceae bacterium]|nr:cytochrome c [Bacteriovoracaceae bacterium]